MSRLAELRITMRPYAPADRNGCLAIFDRNTPDAFAPQERPDFSGFLDAGACPYFGLETADLALVGCGGYYLKPEDGGAGLAWGMIDRAWQRRGLGRDLLTARLDLLRQAGARGVQVHTSQRSRAFFERCGFRAIRVVADGFAPGMDRVDLDLPLP